MINLYIEVCNWKYTLYIFRDHFVYFSLYCMFYTFPYFYETDNIHENLVCIYRLMKIRKPGKKKRMQQMKRYTVMLLKWTIAKLQTYPYVFFLHLYQDCCRVCKVRKIFMQEMQWKNRFKIFKIGIEYLGPTRIWKHQMVSLRLFLPSWC